MNFPPPEFSQPYELPTQANPAARPELYAYLDIAFLVVALGLTAHFVLRQRSRLGVFLVMLASLAYLGFWRHGCVCPIGAIQNVSQALGDPAYALTVAAVAFFVLPLVVTLFCGRVFCAGVCPLGAIQDLVLVHPLRLPAWLSRALGVLPFVYLGLAVLFALCGSLYLICRYDPFVGFFRLSAPASMLGYGALLLLLGTVVGRPYCRFLCPYGALLRVLGPLAWRRARITPTRCSTCTLCRDACPFDAIRAPTPAPEPATRARLRRQLGLVLAAGPLLVAAGGWLGYAAGPAFARLDPTVKLAQAVWQDAHAEGPFTPDTVAADAYRRQGGDPAALFTEAAARTARFQRGGALFGLWLGLVAGAFLVRFTRSPARTIYESDAADCLACGRCFAYCPHEQARRRQQQQEPAAHAS